MRLFVSTLALTLAGLVSGVASAYEPESGLWWNPDESGTGYAIEVQDDMMAVTVYGGAPGGYAKWYTAAGRLDGNALFEADLLSVTNAQPVGMPYTGRPTVEPSYGKLRIVFDPKDNRKATLTWPNGRSLPIQRHEFYFHRAEDTAGVSTETLRMLGEWQIVIDLSTNREATYPFSADVVVLDDYFRNTNDSKWYYEGCRPDDANVGGCSEAALKNHDTAGYFEAPTGLNITLVKDGLYNNVLWYGLYVTKMGTNDGSGSFTLYPQGGNPGAWSAYPARMFRTASRTFVQEGKGPSKQAASASRTTGGLAAQWGQQGWLDAAPKSAPVSTEQGDLMDRVRQLEALLESR